MFAWKIKFMKHVPHTNIFPLIIFAGDHVNKQNECNISRVFGRGIICLVVCLWWILYLVNSI